MYKLILSIVFCLVFTNSFALNFDVKEVVGKYKTKALLINDDQSKSISMIISFNRGGYAYDPSDKQGLAQISSILFNNGAGVKKSSEFLRYLEDNGVVFNSYVDRENFTLHIKFLHDKMKEIFILLDSIFCKFSITEDELQYAKDQVMLTLDKEYENPWLIAENKLMQALFIDHPYSNKRNGSENSIARIGVEDVKSYFSAVFNAVDLKISVVGKCNKDLLSKYMDAYLVNLPLTSTVSEIKYANLSSLNKQYNVSFFMDIPQTMIYFVHESVKYNDNKIYIAYILNSIIGRGLNSILMKELREKKALTYGVSTYIDVDYHSSLFIGNTATTSNDVTSIVSSIEEIIHSIKKNVIDYNRFKKEKEYLVNSFILYLTNNSVLANVLNEAQLNGISKDYIYHYVNMIERVTYEDFTQFARMAFDPDKMVFVIVGNGVSH